jgi:hypothetical protein
MRGTASIRQHIGRVAAIEQQETAYQPELGGAAVESTATDVPTPSNSAKIEELDAAQEELLSWMLFWDSAAQEKDLDEMQDYDELTEQPEFDESFQLEVEDMLEKASEVNLRPGQKVHGTVYEVDEDGAYVEIGAKSAGFVPLSECSLAKLKTVSRASRVCIRSSQGARRQGGPLLNRHRSGTAHRSQPPPPLLRARARRRCCCC